MSHQQMSSKQNIFFTIESLRRVEHPNKWLPVHDYVLFTEWAIWTRQKYRYGGGDPQSSHGPPDERLSEPCQARGLNLGPVVWKRNAPTTQPDGLKQTPT
ncbi:hypothetical protein TNCV_4678471 [Trichonephila clavipes]|nr:hypothetical protein TNCV_4678471 [Trichonephila clavipes]